MRRACVEFRVKLSRDTGTNLTAADCETLLCSRFGYNREVSLETDPGRFYASLGAAVADRELPLVHADHLKVAWYCHREAAVVHAHPGSMNRLARCYYDGRVSVRTLRRLLFRIRRLRTSETSPASAPSFISW